MRIESSLLDLYPFWLPDVGRAMWPHLAEVDLDALVRGRRKQLLVLARYARQSLRQWDDTPVDEIDEWVSLLNELLSEEGEVRKLSETA